LLAAVVNRYLFGMSEPHDDEALAAIERAMVSLRRSVSRRALGARMLCGLGPGVDLQSIGVVDAVEQGPDREGGEVTVGMVGERMGIDPSRASRVVASAIEAGYVVRVPSQADGRRAHLQLTESGAALAESVHALRRRAFDEAMAGWADEDRREFARLLTRFVAGR
jgi:DNA-binding MarR family transcriptional regulator